MTPNALVAAVLVVVAFHAGCAGRAFYEGRQRIQQRDEQLEKTIRGLRL